MVIDHVQDYCDWCMGPLSEASRIRSRWLGLPIEDAWACNGCLQAGRYHVPPDGWNGPPEEWLAGDQYVLGADDVLVIVNALNEILHGPDAIDDSEFQARTGVPREAARQTFQRLSGSAS
ncbi:hypothetical protein [Oerskovia flava]|uniref:hypothetical protein n=1 Tax=Oerskovia flava TaxID=2986422 RepID=UPI00223F62A1|nr:hypothetical protein [Oerskovia sp. JB1-3-2]